MTKKLSVKLLNVLGFDMNIKERIEQLEAELAELKTASTKQWHPKGGEWVAVIMTSYSEEENEQYLKAAGLSFETEKQAEKAVKDFRWYRRLYHLALELNEGWEPDWNNVNEGKYSIVWHRDVRYFIITSCNSFSSPCIVFKSREVAEEAARLIKDCNALEDNL